MARTEIRGEIVKLDYTVLQDTNFTDCKLVFAGGRPPLLKDCDFNNCEFIFEGAADHTRNFLVMLVKSGAASLVVGEMLGLPNWGPKVG